MGYESAVAQKMSRPTMPTFTVPSASMAKPVRAFNDAEADELMFKGLRANRD